MAVVKTRLCDHCGARKAVERYSLQIWRLTSNGIEFNGLHEDEAEYEADLCPACLENLNRAIRRATQPTPATDAKHGKEATDAHNV